MDLSKASYVFGQSRFLLTSLELPAREAEVITTNLKKRHPTLPSSLKLDMSAVWDILKTEEVHTTEKSSSGAAYGISTGETTVGRVNSSFSDDGSAGRSAGMFIL